MNDFLSARLGCRKPPNLRPLAAQWSTSPDNQHRERYGTRNEWRMLCMQVHARSCTKAFSAIVGKSATACRMLVLALNRAGAAEL
jgi:hypothetical protein